MPANKGVSYKSKSGTGRNKCVEAARLIEPRRTAKGAIPLVPRKRSRLVPKAPKVPLVACGDLQAVKDELAEAIAKVDEFGKRVGVLRKRWECAVRKGIAYVTRAKRLIKVQRVRPRRWHRKHEVKLDVLEKIEERADAQLENAEVDLEAAVERVEELSAQAKRFCGCARPVATNEIAAYAAAKEKGTSRRISPVVV